MASRLPVMEMFHSIQGEGYFAGSSAAFVRLAGCDVGCPWCDVKESWDAGIHELISVADIRDFCSENSSDIVIITGGEPAMYDLTKLCEALHANHKQIHIETSGAYPLVGQFDWVTYSPKKFKEPLSEVGAIADELKVVVLNKSDFTFAEKHAKQVREQCLLYLQPEWEKREKTEALIVEYMSSNPKWKLSVQSHKYLGIR
jgi:7-carboxy-7-deazaguanine synthase